MCLAAAHQNLEGETKGRNEGQRSGKRRRPRCSTGEVNQHVLSLPDVVTPEDGNRDALIAWRGAMARSWKTEEQWGCSILHTDAAPTVATRR
jgi:hypothetical protein